MPHKITLVVLGLFLFCCSMIIYSGRVLGIDGRAMIATSESFITQQSWDINLLSSEYWISPPPGGQITWNTDTIDAYSKKTPLVALAHLPLAFIGYALPFTEWLQISLLTLPLIFALSGVLLYQIARAYAISAPIALAGVIWWGIGTFALPNTIAVFAEPIMALGVLLLFWGYIAPNQTIHRRALYCGLGTMLVFGGNLASAPITTVVLGAFFFREIVPNRDWRALLYLATPILLMIAIIAYFNILRSGNPLTSGYFFDSGEGFTTPFFEGLFGLLVGSYRGLIWYAPITMLTLFGWLHRRQYLISYLALATIIMQVVIYSSWWSWYGGITWGPRFLLPILPLCVLLAMPAIDWLWRYNLLGKLLLIGLVILSAVSQISGSFIHYTYYEIYLSNQYGADIPNLAFLPWQDNPLLINLTFLSPERAWSAWAVAGDWHTGRLLIGIACTQGLLLIALYLDKTQRYKHAIMWASIILMGFSGFFAVNSATRIWQQDVSEIQQFLDTQGRASDAILLNNITHWRFTALDNRPEMYSLPSDVASDDVIATAIVDAVLENNDRTWLFTPLPVANWIEARIWETAYVGSLTTVDSYRVLSFQQLDISLTYNDLDIQFDQLDLLAYGTHQTEQDIYLSLFWQGEMPDNGSMFIHLLNSAGGIIHQHDYLPVNGLVSLADGVYDNHLLSIPETYQNDTLSIRIGWVDADGNFIQPSAINLDTDFLTIPLSEN